MRNQYKVLAEAYEGVSKEPRRYVAKYQGKQAGYASVVPYKNNGAMITVVKIERQYRGLGLGTRLLKHVINTEFTKRNTDYIVLQAKPDLELGFNVKQWYERLGFELLNNDLMVLYKP